MEDRVEPGELPYTPRTQIAFFTVAALIMLVMSLSGLISRVFWIRVQISSLCMAVMGFSLGYMPRRAERMSRMTIIVLAFSQILILWRTVNSMVYGTSKESFETMLSPQVLGLTLLLVVVGVLAFKLGDWMFRNRYPELTPVPQILEERQQVDEATRTSNRRFLLRSQLVVFFCFILVVICSSLFPHHRGLMYLLTLLLMSSFVSGVMGWRWEMLDPVMKWVGRIMCIIGPVVFFTGLYYGAKTQDHIHLLRAIKYSGAVAAAMIVPALTARVIAASRRNSP